MGFRVQWSEAPLISLPMHQSSPASPPSRMTDVSAIQSKSIELGSVQLPTGVGSMRTSAQLVLALRSPECHRCA